MTGEIYDAIILAWGDSEVPEELWNTFDELEAILKRANGKYHSPTDDICLRSTQIASLVVLLWKRGVLK